MGDGVRSYAPDLSRRNGLDGNDGDVSRRARLALVGLAIPRLPQRAERGRNGAAVPRRDREPLVGAFLDVSSVVAALVADAAFKKRIS